MTAFAQINACYRPSLGPAMTVSRVPGGLEVAHGLNAWTVSDSRMIAGLVALIESGSLVGQVEFEAAAVAVIESVPHADPWACFYRNTLTELREHRSPFAPVHARARAEIVGASVLEVGSCFGFLALGSALDGLDVTACDISAGAVSMLSAASSALGIPVTTRVGDARALPFADDAFDTVTLIHLLEHLDGPGITDALTEALRVARDRVVVAVPYEDVPSPHFGHLHSLDEGDLRRWAGAVEHSDARVFEDHGGWLVLTPVGAQARARVDDLRLVGV